MYVIQAESSGMVAPHVRHRLFLVAFLVLIIRPCLSLADSDHAMSTLSNLDIIVETLSVFQKDTGRLPTEAEGLEALRKKPCGIAGWQGPYIDENVRLIDAWGNEFVYVLDSGGQSPQACVYSIGLNGVDEFGQGDDVNATSCASVERD